MLVYDITNEKTFENIVKWLRNIDEVSIMYSILQFTNLCFISYIKHIMIVVNISYSMQMKMWRK